MRPVLKSVAWERLDGQLRIIYDLRDHFLVDDPNGVVESLLVLLREGTRSISELAAVLRVPAGDVVAAVTGLDGYGLLESGDALRAVPAAVAERHFSNLAFFESFGSLGRGRVDFCRSLWDAHVLVLGVGGLNSNVVPHLAGLGVGRLTLVDCDVVDARNFARQYLYRAADTGQRKVAKAAEWVRHFDPAIEVSTVDGRIDGPGYVAELLDRCRPDAVAAGADSPDQIDAWVNAACVPAGVPFVRGGMWVTQGVVWSVSPGESACVACRSFASGPSAAGPDVASLDAEQATVRLHGTRERTNRGIGPVAGLLGSLAAFEVLRYLTGFEPPAYAGAPLMIDFAAGCTMRQTTWNRDPSCTVCAGVAGHRAPGPVPAIGGR